MSACDEWPARQTGSLALPTGRLPSGERAGLAFISDASLLLTTGPFQQWGPAVHLDGTRAELVLRLLARRRGTIKMPG